MKKDKKMAQGNEPVRPAKTSREAKVNKPSKSSSKENNDETFPESPEGKIKRKDSATADRERAPNEEL